MLCIQFQIGLQLYSTCYHSIMSIAKQSIIMNIIVIGNAIDAESSDYIWLGSICDPLLNLPTTSVTQNIWFPLVNSFDPLRKLVTALKQLLGNNFMAALGMLGGLVLGIGFETIIERFGFCPVVLATGGLSCGKTTTLKALLYCLGSCPISKYHHYSRCSATCLKSVFFCIYGLSF